mgnify:CR=1 FL=1
MPKKSADIAIVPWQADKIVSRRLADLTPSKTNSRHHPPEQIAFLRASLRQFGFPKPILIDTKSEIIAGHGITQAAMEEGLISGPTITAEGWTEEQKRAYRIFDNWSATQSQWMPDVVDSEIAALRDVKFDLEPLGLDNIQLPEIDDVVPVPPKSNRSKTTIFVSISNPQVEKARKTIIAALDKARIPHNL